MEQDIRLEIREILEQEIGSTLDEYKDEDLLFEGLIALDSLMTLQIIVELEDKFQIQIGEDDINADFFMNINNMHSVISKYL